MLGWSVGKIKPNQTLRNPVVYTASCTGVQTIHWNPSSVHSFIYRCVDNTLEPQQCSRLHVQVCKLYLGTLVVYTASCTGVKTKPWNPSTVHSFMYRCVNNKIETQYCTQLPVQVCKQYNRILVVLTSLYTGV